MNVDPSSNIRITNTEEMDGGIKATAQLGSKTLVFVVKVPDHTLSKDAEGAAEKVHDIAAKLFAQQTEVDGGLFAPGTVLKHDGMHIPERGTQEYSATGRGNYQKINEFAQGLIGSPSGSASQASQSTSPGGLAGIKKKVKVNPHNTQATTNAALNALGDGHVPPGDGTGLGDRKVVHEESLGTGANTVAHNTLPSPQTPEQKLADLTSDEKLRQTFEGVEVPDFDSDDIDNELRVANEGIDSRAQTLKDEVDEKVPNPTNDPALGLKITQAKEKIDRAAAKKKEPIIAGHAAKGSSVQAARLVEKRKREARAKIDNALQNFMRVNAEVNEAITAAGADGPLPENLEEQITTAFDTANQEFEEVSTDIGDTPGFDDTREKVSTSTTQITELKTRTLAKIRKAISDRKAKVHIETATSGTMNNVGDGVAAGLTQKAQVITDFATTSAESLARLQEEVNTEFDGLAAGADPSTLQSTLTTKLTTLSGTIQENFAKLPHVDAKENLISSAKSGAEQKISRDTTAVTELIASRVTIQGTANNIKTIGDGATESLRALSEEVEAAFSGTGTVSENTIRGLFDKLGLQETSLHKSVNDLAPDGSHERITTAQGTANQSITNAVRVISEQIQTGARVSADAATAKTAAIGAATSEINTLVLNPFTAPEFTFNPNAPDLSAEETRINNLIAGLPKTLDDNIAEKLKDLPPEIRTNKAVTDAIDLAKQTLRSASTTKNESVAEAKRSAITARAGAITLKSSELNEAISDLQTRLLEQISGSDIETFNGIASQAPTTLDNELRRVKSELQKLRGTDNPIPREIDSAINTAEELFSTTIGNTLNDAINSKATSLVSGLGDVAVSSITAFEGDIERQFRALPANGDIDALVSSLNTTLTTKSLPPQRQNDKISRGITHGPLAEAKSGAEEKIKAAAKKASALIQKKEGEARTAQTTRATAIAAAQTKASEITAAVPGIVANLNELADREVEVLQEPMSLQDFESKKVFILTQVLRATANAQLGQVLRGIGENPPPVVTTAKEQAIQTVKEALGRQAQKLLNATHVPLPTTVDTNPLGTAAPSGTHQTGEARWDSDINRTPLVSEEEKAGARAKDNDIEAFLRSHPSQREVFNNYVGKVTGPMQVARDRIIKLTGASRPNPVEGITSQSLNFLSTISEQVLVDNLSAVIGDKFSDGQGSSLNLIKEHIETLEAIIGKLETSSAEIDGNNGLGAEGPEIKSLIKNKCQETIQRINHSITSLKAIATLEMDTTGIDGETISTLSQTSLNTIAAALREPSQEQYISVPLPIRELRENTINDNVGAIFQGKEHVTPQGATETHLSPTSVTEALKHIEENRIVALKDSSQDLFPHHLSQSELIHNPEIRPRLRPIFSAIAKGGEGSAHAAKALYGDLQRDLWEKGIQKYLPPLEEILLTSLHDLHRPDSLILKDRMEVLASRPGADYWGQMGDLPEKETSERSVMIRDFEASLRSLTPPRSTTAQPLSKEDILTSVRQKATEHNRKINNNREILSELSEGRIFDERGPNRSPTLLDRVAGGFHGTGKVVSLEFTSATSSQPDFTWKFEKKNDGRVICNRSDKPFETFTVHPAALFALDDVPFDQNNCIPLMNEDTGAVSILRLDKTARGLEGAKLDTSLSLRSFLPPPQGLAVDPAARDTTRLQELTSRIPTTKLAALTRQGDRRFHELDQRRLPEELKPGTEISDFNAERRNAIGIGKTSVPNANISGNVDAQKWVRSTRARLRSQRNALLLRREQLRREISNVYPEILTGPDQELDLKKFINEGDRIPDHIRNGIQSFLENYHLARSYKRILSSLPPPSECTPKKCSEIAEKLSTVQPGMMEAIKPYHRVALVYQATTGNTLRPSQLEDLRGAYDETLEFKPAGTGYGKTEILNLLAVILHTKSMQGGQAGRKVCLSTIAPNLGTLRERVDPLARVLGAHPATLDVGSISKRDLTEQATVDRLLDKIENNNFLIISDEERLQISLMALKHPDETVRNMWTPLHRKLQSIKQVMDEADSQCIVQDPGVNAILAEKFSEKIDAEITPEELADLRLMEVFQFKDSPVGVSATIPPVLQAAIMQKTLESSKEASREDKTTGRMRNFTWLQKQTTLVNNNSAFNLDTALSQCRALATEGKGYNVLLVDMNNEIARIDKSAGEVKYNEQKTAAAKQLYNKLNAGRTREQREDVWFTKQRGPQKYWFRFTAGSDEPIEVTTKEQSDARKAKGEKINYFYAYDEAIGTDTPQSGSSDNHLGHILVTDLRVREQDARGNFNSAKIDERDPVTGQRSQKDSLHYLARAQQLLGRAREMDSENQQAVVFTRTGANDTETIEAIYNANEDRNYEDIPSILRAQLKSTMTSMLRDETKLNAIRDITAISGATGARIDRFHTQLAKEMHGFKRVLDKKQGDRNVWNFLKYGQKEKVLITPPDMGHNSSPSTVVGLKEFVTTLERNFGHLAGPSSAKTTDFDTMLDKLNKLTYTPAGHAAPSTCSLNPALGAELEALKIVKTEENALKQEGIDAIWNVLTEDVGDKKESLMDLFGQLRTSDERNAVRENVIQDLSNQNPEIATEIAALVRLWLPDPPISLDESLEKINDLLQEEDLEGRPPQDGGPLHKLDVQLAKYKENRLSNKKLVKELERLATRARVSCQNYKEQLEEVPRSTDIDPRALEASIIQSEKEVNHALYLLMAELNSSMNLKPLIAGVTTSIDNQLRPLGIETTGQKRQKEEMAKHHETFNRLNTAINGLPDNHPKKAAFKTQVGRILPKIISTLREIGKDEAQTNADIRKLDGDLLGLERQIIKG